LEHPLAGRADDALDLVRDPGALMQHVDDHRRMAGFLLVRLTSWHAIQRSGSSPLYDARNGEEVVTWL